MSVRSVTYDSPLSDSEDESVNDDSRSLISDKSAPELKRSTYAESFTDESVVSDQESEQSYQQKKSSPVKYSASLISKATIVSNKSEESRKRTFISVFFIFIVKISYFIQNTLEKRLSISFLVLPHLGRVSRENLADTSFVI